MIGYYCYRCGCEHAYQGDCPYDKCDNKKSYDDYWSKPVKETERVSIPRNMRIGETVRVYVGGKEITLERTK